MGMFDYVDTDGPVKCPKCGSDVVDFQTKSTDCTLQTVHWTETADFYSSCEKCKTWIEFTRKREKCRFKGFNMQTEED